MINPLVIIMIIAALVFYIYKRSTGTTDALKKIEEEKKPLIEKVNRLETERETLKDKATVQEKDATEEHKQEFWDKYNKEDK